MVATNQAAPANPSASNTPASSKALFFSTLRGLARRQFYLAPAGAPTAPSTLMSYFEVDRNYPGLME